MSPRISANRGMKMEKKMRVIRPDFLHVSLKLMRTSAVLGPAGAVDNDNNSQLATDDDGAPPTVVCGPTIASVCAQFTLNNVCDDVVVVNVVDDRSCCMMEESRMIGPPYSEQTTPTGMERI